MDKLTVRAYMTPTPTTIDAAATLEAATALMREHGFRHLPVTSDGQVVGILSERDVLAGGSTVGAAMTAAPFFISPASSLEWAAMLMAEQKCGALLVLEADQLVGILTTTDAAHALEQLLGRARRRRHHTR